MALILCYFFLLTAPSFLAQSLPAADKGGGGKGRALGAPNNLTQVEKAIDDVSMEEDGMAAPCSEGQVIEHGCEEKCVCTGGKLNCTQRCVPPFVRSVMGTTDPNCVLKPTPDICCSSLVCSNNDSGSALINKGCMFKNETYKHGEIFHDGCTSTCNCMENGEVSCRPRCPATNRTTVSDRCLSVADSKDPCCKILYCDVNADEMGMDESMEYLKLVSAIPSNATSVMLNFDRLSIVDKVQAEISVDQNTWTPATTIGQMIIGLTPGKTYYFRVLSEGVHSNIVSATLPNINKIASECEFKGKTYKLGEEFHDGCTAYCACSKSGVECAAIECPTEFGLDVLDPHCIAWETKPADFVPSPPHCCPETLVCVNNGSCIYKGERFENWADIPDKLTGCEEKCFCSTGNVTCSARCQPVPNSPPAGLPCSPNIAILSHTPGEDGCCLQWMCPQPNGTAPIVTNNSVNDTKMRQSPGHEGSSVPFLGPYNPEILGKADKPQTHTTKQKTSFPGPYAFDNDKPTNHSVKQKLKPETTTKNILQSDLSEVKNDSNSTEIKNVKKPDFDVNGPVRIDMTPSSKEADISHNKSSMSTLKPIVPNKVPIGVLNPDAPNKKPFGVLPDKEIKTPTVNSKSETKTKNKNVDKLPQVPQNENTNLQFGDNSTERAPGIPNYEHKPTFDKDSDEDHKEQLYPYGNKHDTQNVVSYGDPSVQKLPTGISYSDGINKVSSRPDGSQSLENPDSESKYTGSIWPGQEQPSKIPIGIINPDKLNNLDKKPQGVPPNLPHPHINPNLLDHLLEYHRFQEKAEPNQNNYQTQNAHQYDIQLRPNPHLDNSNQINAYNMRPHNIIPGKGGSKDDVQHHLPYPNLPEHVNQVPQQQPPPHLYHLLPNGPQNFPRPNGGLPPQYVSPEELYLVQNQHRLPQKQNINPYYNGPPTHTRKDPNHYQNPNAPPLGLEDIIDQIRQHDGTDSHTKDTHVIVLASQPPNAGQGVAPGPRPIPGFPPHPSQHDSNGIVVHTLEAVDENNVRLIFSVPLVLVGLHGRVELRYTSDKENSDPSTWEQKVFAPANDLIATPELEFELEDLQPDTEYKIKITVVMRDIENSPASKILVVKTPPAASQATVPPMIPVEPDLRVTKVNSTWAVLEWRKFTDDELHFIDGVQLRYKEINGKVYQATPLIHRAVTSYTLEGLKPDSQYEIGIFFIPFPGQTTELQAQKTLHFSTKIENDPYKFELLLEVHHIKSTSVEINWSGVPYPEDKYVNIFRAIYQYDGGREYMNSFKVAKRDSPASTLIQGLKPDTRYRLWIEAYLTNGRIKKSNVKDFTTKQGIISSGDVRQGKLESPLSETNDYYGPLIGVSILAAIAILAALGLLIVIARKHGHNKAPITAAVQRKSAPHTAAYDNPSYKVEMQHETMDL